MKKLTCIYIVRWITLFDRYWTSHPRNADLGKIHQIDPVIYNKYTPQVIHGWINPDNKDNVCQVNFWNGITVNDKSIFYHDCVLIEKKSTFNSRLAAFYCRDILDGNTQFCIIIKMHKQFFMQLGSLSNITMSTVFIFLTFNINKM